MSDSSHNHDNPSAPASHVSLSEEPPLSGENFGDSNDPSTTKMKKACKLLKDEKLTDSSSEKSPSDPNNTKKKEEKKSSTSGNTKKTKPNKLR